MHASPTCIARVTCSWVAVSFAKFEFLWESRAEFLLLLLVVFDGQDFLCPSHVVDSCDERILCHYDLKTDIGDVGGHRWSCICFCPPLPQKLVFTMSASTRG